MTYINCQKPDETDWAYVNEQTKEGKLSTRAATERTWLTGWYQTRALYRSLGFRMTLVSAIQPGDHIAETPWPHTAREVTAIKAMPNTICLTMQPPGKPTSKRRPANNHVVACRGKIALAAPPLGPVLNNPDHVVIAIAQNTLRMPRPWDARLHLVVHNYYGQMLSTPVAYFTAWYLKPPVYPDPPKIYIRSSSETDDAET